MFLRWKRGCLEVVFQSLNFDFVNYLANPDKIYGSRLDPSFDFKGRATLRLNSMLTISSTDNILSSDIAISAEKSSDRYSSYSLSLSLDYKF